MENIQWIFSGIGTEILKLMGGAIVGGITGYKIGVKKSYKQIQKASDSAKQKQELIDEDETKIVHNKKSVTKIMQKQKAGKHSEQSQIGRIHNGK